jgi:hypothetical protein
MDQLETGTVQFAIFAEGHVSTQRTCKFALGLTIVSCLMGCGDDNPTSPTNKDAAVIKDAGDAGQKPDGAKDVVPVDAAWLGDTVADLPDGRTIDTTVTDVRTPVDGEAPKDSTIDGAPSPLDTSADNLDAPAADGPADVSMGDSRIDGRVAAEVATDTGPACVDGTTESCASLVNPLVGACRAGTRVCSGGNWGACSEVLPAATEACNGVDDNCNGMIDEGCATGCLVVCAKCVSGTETAPADGSVAHPFATVEAALAAPAAVDGGAQKRICVVGGATCRESTLYPMNGPLKMTDGLVIQGAYAITESGLEYCGVPTVRPRTTLAFSSSEGVVFDQAISTGAELSSLVIEINPPSSAESPATTGTAIAVKGAKNVSLGRVFVTEGFAANSTYGVAITSGGQATITGSSISAGQGRASAVGVYVNGGTVNMRNNCDRIVDGRCASYCDDGGAMLGAHGYAAASTAESPAQASAMLVTGSSSAALVGNMFCGGTSNLGSGQSPALVSTIRCEGTGCTTVSGNVVAGGDGPVAVGIALVGASPMVDRNLVEGGCGDTATTGVWVEGSSSRLQNNLILAGQCPGTGTPAFCGLHVIMGGTADGPDVHSNDIEPLGLSADCQSIGVLVERAGSASSITGGVLRNNIVSAGTCDLAVAISEGPGASLQSLKNNDLYAPTRPATAGPVVLYRRATGDLTTAAQVNALSLASGNISADPGYASYPRNLHLTATSPCIDQGIAAGAPATDIDGRVRSADLGPDIGAYELGE